MTDLSDNEKLISLYPEYDPDPDIIYPYTPGLDNSSVRCICSVPFDDGATIQCDGCWVWQHMVCMEIDRSVIPKVYYCEECKIRPVDVQKAITNQAKMQKLRRGERVDAIKEILIRKGIMDKPSPRRKKESRGRKVLPSPRKQVKAVSIKQSNSLKKDTLQITETQSPLGSREVTSRSGVGVMPDFPFRSMVCLDDWTDGFLGKGTERNKKSSLENPFDLEYSDWAINCATVQGNRFLGKMEAKVAEFINFYEEKAPFWQGGQLLFSSQVLNTENCENIVIDDSKIVLDLNSDKSSLTETKNEEYTQTFVKIKNEEGSDSFEMDQDQKVAIEFTNKVEEICQNNVDSVIEEMYASDSKMNDLVEGNVSGIQVDNQAQNDIISDDQSIRKDMDVDSKDDHMPSEESVQENAGDQLIEDNTDTKADQTIISEAAAKEKVLGALKVESLISKEELSAQAHDVINTNTSTLDAKDLDSPLVMEVAQKSTVFVTNKKILRTSPVRYCVDLIPIKEENQIPYYGLFSTCIIPSDSFICTTFGNLTDISDTNPSLLPCQIENDIYTLPPFTLKALPRENWILDCRTRGDMSGRYCRRSCASLTPNASLYCLIVKDETLLNEKLVFGIFSSKEISAGEEIVLDTPNCYAFPCSCDDNIKCSSKEHFSKIGDTFKNRDVPNSLEKREVKVTKNINISKRLIAKKKLPMFLRVLVLSHRKKIKSLKGTLNIIDLLDQKIPEPSFSIPHILNNSILHHPPEPPVSAVSSTRTSSVNPPKIKPPPSPVLESPKTLSREERKLKDQLALFEKMEQQDRKKRKRRGYDEPLVESASPSSKKGGDDSEEENNTGSSSKIDNETPESLSRDSPLSVIDIAEKEDESESKRKSESIPACESVLFKKPKLNEKEDQDTPAPLVRKLSLKDFLQKRNQNKTPSPSSSGHFFSLENPES